MNADRHLLFGCLALQNNFISRDELVAAVGVWLADKSRPLEEILLERNALAEDERQLLAALVRKHLEKHQGDAERSLAALDAAASLRDGLRHLKGRVGNPSYDAEIEQTLAQLPAANTGRASQDAATLGYAPGEARGQRFRILRPHARGGLGEVFVASDLELNREVALKEIQQHHADNPTSRARFVMEAEITGGLEHPGIVPVYGLGHYGDGRPFYAMRFIRGDSLKEAVDRFHVGWVSNPSPDQPTDATHGRTTHGRVKNPSYDCLEFRQLLGRFIDVCNAVEYAHSRGVLHRDLKPGNVMLGRYGETLVVDWGLAKVVGRSDEHEQSPERTLVPSSGSGSARTEVGATLGTPAYMSPEQAAGRLEELGVASDVYSLGATLYYLLTGRLPFDDHNVGHVLGQVQRGEFRRPREVNPHVPQPLEAICLKAMSLRASDRYPSPQALADDVERWRADQPVSAWPEPLSIRARRWMRLHQTLVATSAAAVVLSTVGLIVLSAVVSGKNAALARSNEALSAANTTLDRQKTELSQKNQQLVAAHDKTAAAEKQARQEADIAKAINDFLHDDLLGQASPQHQPDRNLKLRDVLDRAAESIGDRFTSQPLVEAEIRQTIGVTYEGLGEYGKAESHFRRALDLREEALGSDHDDTLSSMNNLGALCYRQGRYGEAEPLLRQGMEISRRVLGPEDPGTLIATNDLALLYDEIGRRDEAEALFKKTLEISHRVLGEDDQNSLSTANNLAVLYCRQGRFDEAEPLYDRTLASMRRVLGEEHPNTLTASNNLASVYREQGRLAEAQRLFQQALAITRRVLGNEHPETLVCMNNLATLYDRQGRHDESESLHKEALAIRRRTLGETHPHTISSMSNLANVYWSTNRLELSIPLFEAALKAFERGYGADHPETLQAAANLGINYRDAGRLDEALPLLERAHRASQTQRSLGWIAEPLTDAYQQAGQFDKAEPLLRSALDEAVKQHGLEHAVTLHARGTLGWNLIQQRKFAAAEPLFREGLAIREKQTPHGWLYFNTQSLLGETLTGTKQFAAAEELLLSGHQGMQQHQSEIPPAAAKVRFRESLQRLVDLYTAWDKPDEAQKWQAELKMP